MREEKLLQRCLKICEATTKRLLATTNNINRIGTTSHIHDNINTGLSCSSSQTVTECRAFSSSDVFDKEKDMIQPFHVFEKGSTSSTTNDSCTPISETITTKGNMFVVITPIQGSGRGVTPGCK
uniref:Uncharacterized protein isoform X4 n=1 Tax=Nicotiana tabacum TaxID=4097 RepID=A0A1S4ACG8_TOBAC|nr:PREDICTED: uncharacterized protein LOC107796029 isoform X4 [Nicotiana tabacum]